MKIFKWLFNRFFVVSLVIILQIAFILLLFIYGSVTSIFVQIAASVIGLIMLVHILTTDIMPEQKLLWGVLLVAFPVAGIGLYFMLGDAMWTRRTKERMRRSFFKQAPTVNACTDLPEKYSGQIDYLVQVAGTAAYRGCATQYFPSGKEYLASLLSDLEAAEKYVFMEFFIVEEGRMLNPILDILEKKIGQGVEVRFMYDDIGSVRKVPAGFYKKLRKRGLNCVKFNRYTPFVTNLHNNRDHRKIVVIDGKIAYTGGFNLADEYINEAGRNYYWKDTGVRIEGNAVGEFAELFLQLNEMTVKKENLDFADYIDRTPVDKGEDGIIVPFGTGPRFFYKTPVASEAFLNMINEAEREIVITTPYLILDYSLNRALCLAVLRGVDVKVVIPDVPDKKTVYLMTKNNAEYLYDRGVSVYRSTGAFLHAKSIMVDGEAAILGTINFDFRSFLHHFENGVFMYKTKAVEALRADVESLCVKENEFGEDVRSNAVGRMLYALVKIFIPLF